MTDSSYSYTYECVQGSNPPCTSVCPLNFYTRDFISKLKKGNFNAAYKEYAKNVIFPKIVSLICNEDCGSICPEKVSVLELERASVKYAVKKDPINYNQPERSEKVAVIGAGLSGLACAQRLAARGYQITIYNNKNNLGGSLNNIIDQKTLDEEFELQFKYLNYNYINEKILNLEKLDYDAVYIATGKGGEDFGLLENWNKQSLATSKKGVFLGGRLTGCSHMEALKHGMTAAASIEKYIKVGSMTGQPGTFHNKECKIPIKPGGLKPERIIPSNGKYYSEEEAVCESSRCTLCDCTECKDRCEFMQHMDIFPRKIESDSQMARSADEGLFEKVGTRMIVSCSVCGHCGSVCPKNINVEDILTESKKFLYESGHFPPALHDFYIRDMIYSMTESYISKAAPGYNKASYMLFPGCQMTASNTDHVEKAYKYMLEKSPDTALMLGCCGVPALWAGNHNMFYDMLTHIKNDWVKLGKPVIVTACSTCAKTFKKYTNFEIISLYEFINKNGLPDKGTFFEGKWVVFDPCGSRDFPEMQESVRSLSIKLGAELTEIKDSKKEARCCGMGGHIYPANPEVFHKMLNASVNESNLPYISYCTNCRNLFLSAGKNTKHILDNVFGLEALKKPYHISDKRKNRLELKKNMLNNIWGENFEIMEKEYSIKLIIPEEVYDKMDRLHISEEDVYQAAEHCHKNNETVFDAETNIYTGHLQVGIITYWIQYKKEEDFLQLINVYSHRIMIS